MTPATNAPEHSQRRFFAKLLLVVCILAIVSCCLAAGYNWKQRRDSLRLLQSRLADAANSDAWVEQQLQERTSTEGTAAWSQLVELCEYSSSTLATKVPIVGEGKLPTFGPGVEHGWADIEATEAYLTEMQPAIELLKRSRDVEMPVWMAMQFDGVQTLLPELQAGRSISRLAHLEHLYSLYTGDTARAMDALRSLHAVPQAFDWNLFLVGELVHNALRGIFLGAVKDSLKAGAWNDEQLAELEQMVAEPLDIPARWEKTLLLERTIVFGRSSAFPIQYDLFIAPEDRLALLDDYQAAIDLANVPTQELVSRANRLEQERERQSQSGSPGYQALHSTIFPAISGFANALIRLETQQQVTAVAIAIKRFELANDRWPQDLSELQASDFNPGEWFESWTTPDSNWEYYTSETVAGLNWTVADAPGIIGDPSQLADWLQAIIARDAIEPSSAGTDVR